MSATTEWIAVSGSVADGMTERVGAAGTPAHVAGLLRYAADSTAAQLLQPGLQHWLSPQLDALAGFIDVGPRRITAGLPLAAAEREAAVLRQYLQATRRAGRRAVLVGIDGERAMRLAQEHGLAALQIGTQPIWRPADWPQLLARQRGLRSELSRARNRQITLHEVSPSDAAADPAVAACRRAWLGLHPLPPFGFVLAADGLGQRHERRVWLARRDGPVEAYLAAWPVAARRGWLFEIVRRPQAPGGTSELLIDAALRAVAESGAEQATLGLVPLDGAAGSGRITVGLRLALRALRRHGQRLYHFDGLAAFRARLQPHRREAVWLLSDEPAVSLLSALALAGALTGPRPLDYLRQVLQRRS